MTKPIQIASIAFAICLLSANANANTKTSATATTFDKERKQSISVFSQIDGEGKAISVGESKDQKKSGTSISGSIKFVGPKPKPRRVPLANQTDCAKVHKKPLLIENAIVGDGGELANVFVYIKTGIDGKNYPPSKTPAVLDQIKCRFSPRVQGVQVGQTLELKNSDAMLHNVRSLTDENRPFNIAQPAGSEARTKVFKRAELAVRMQCDLHPWMTSYVHIMAHPFFAVTGTDGTFRIKGLPKGDYTLGVWHELYGEQESKISVDAKGVAKANFTFKPKPKKAR